VQRQGLKDVDLLKEYKYLQNVELQDNQLTQLAALSGLVRFAAVCPC
jgi:hypothetical protein